MKQFFDATDSCATNMQVRVFFGTPSNGCAGSGVCKMLPLHLTIHNGVPCPSFLTHCRFDSNAVTLQVSQGQLTEHQFHRWFASDYFAVEEDFWLPRWLVKRLDGKQRLIPAGSYSFRLHQQAIEVRLRLLEREETILCLNPAV